MEQWEVDRQFVVVVGWALLIGEVAGKPLSFGMVARRWVEPWQFGVPHGNSLSSGGPPRSG